MALKDLPRSTLEMVAEGYEAEARQQFNLRKDMEKIMERSGMVTSAAVTLTHFDPVASRWHEWEQEDPDVNNVIRTERILPKGVMLVKLYRITLVYGENRLKPLVIERMAVGQNADEAKMRSGIMAEVKEEWDPDFVTILPQIIGDVAVKERAEEVKVVE